LGPNPSTIKTKNGVEMNRRNFLILLAASALIVMSSMAQVQETRSGGQTSAISAKLQENMSNDGEFSSPVIIKVPIKLVNNSTKIA